MRFDLLRTIASFHWRLFFTNLSGALMLGLFLLTTGFFTWMYGQDVFYRNEASLQAFYDVAYWTLFFFVPAWGMSWMAWERQSGHWKMLVARGLSHGEIVLGKWCALVALAALALLLCAPYAVVLSLLGAEPVGLLVAGYLALGVYAASMAAIGIAAGAMTPYPPVAYLIAAAIGLFFQYIFGMLAEWFAGGWLRVFDHFHFGYHLQNLFAGRLEFSAVVFFASSIAFFLWLARLPWAVRRNRPILSLSKAAARAPSDAPAASTSGAS